MYVASCCAKRCARCASWSDGYGDSCFDSPMETFCFGTSEPCSRRRHHQPRPRSTCARTAGSSTQIPTVSIRDFPFHAALLIIGDELLDGRVADTNTRALARLCRARGAQLVETRSVRDDADAIDSALRALAGRAKIVVTSGGLRPTVDDPTPAGIARAARGARPRSRGQARVAAYTSREAAVTEPASARPICPKARSSSPATSAQPTRSR